MSLIVRKHLQIFEKLSVIKFFANIPFSFSQLVPVEFLKAEL